MDRHCSAIKANRCDRVAEIPCHQQLNYRCRHTVVECHEEMGTQRWKLIVKRGRLGHCTLMSGCEEWTTSPICPHVGAQWLNRSRSLLRVAVDWQSSVQLKSRNAHRQADRATGHGAQSQNSEPENTQLAITPLQNSQQVNVQNFAMKRHPEVLSEGAENMDMLKQQSSHPKACSQPNSTAENCSAHVHKVPYCAACLGCSYDVVQYEHCTAYARTVTL